MTTVQRMVVAAMGGAVAGAIAIRVLAPGTRAQLDLSPAMKVSVGLWVLFSVYWSIASKNSAATQTSETSWSRQLHVVLVNGALLLLVLPIPGLTQRFLPERRWLVVAGLVIQAAFIAFAVWSRRHLGRNWSGEVRIATDHELVRSGPYRYIRHPIYTAVLGMYCGTALVSGQIHALVGLVVVTAAYWRKIGLEERALEARFGADHAAYRRGTWNLIPYVY